MSSGLTCPDLAVRVSRHGGGVASVPSQRRQTFLGCHGASRIRCDGAVTIPGSTQSTCGQLVRPPLAPRTRPIATADGFDVQAALAAADDIVKPFIAWLMHASKPQPVGQCAP